jgi:ribonuclease-3
VLGCAVADELYGRYPHLPEGKLTQLRASLVREEALAQVARGLGLAGRVRAGAPLSASVLADALEAVIGAIFLDGGYPAARRAVVEALGPLLEQLDPGKLQKDAKTQLQELLQARGKQPPKYQVTATHGAPHSRTFDVECVVDDVHTRGQGTSRQRAEQSAAAAMLDRLQ